MHEISDPDNERYGESMTVEEVSEFTAPNAEDTKVVHEWIEAVRYNSVQHDAMYVSFYNLL